MSQSGDGSVLSLCRWKGVDLAEFALVGRGGGGGGGGRGGGGRSAKDLVKSFRCSDCRGMVCSCLTDTDPDVSTR